MADFVEICNICARKAIIEAAKRIINSDKMCRSYSDLNFGVTFFGTRCTSLLILVSSQLLQQWLFYVITLSISRIDTNACSGCCVYREQAENPELDVITGFHIADPSIHLVVLEALREGAAKDIAQYSCSNMSFGSFVHRISLFCTKKFGICEVSVVFLSWFLVASKFESQSE